MMGEPRVFTREELSRATLLTCHEQPSERTPDRVPLFDAIDMMSVACTICSAEVGDTCRIHDTTARGVLKVDNVYFHGCRLAVIHAAYKARS